ncbi:hypothetical protein KKC91_07025 [bacterium]|nr:hypothetical protein [bacterium]
MIRKYTNRFLILFLIVGLFRAQLFAVDFGYDKIDFFGKEKEEGPRITIKTIEKKPCEGCGKKGKIVQKQPISEKHPKNEITQLIEKSKQPKIEGLMFFVTDKEPFLSQTMTKVKEFKDNHSGFQIEGYLVMDFLGTKGDKTIRAFRKVKYLDELELAVDPYSKAGMARKFDIRRFPSYVFVKNDTYHKIAGTYVELEKLYEEIYK